MTNDAEPPFPPQVVLALPDAPVQGRLMQVAASPGIGMPARAPLAMPPQPLRAARRSAPAQQGARGQGLALRLAAGGAALALAALLVLALMQSLRPALDTTPWLALGALALFALNTLWVAWAAVTAAIGAYSGFAAQAPHRPAAPPAGQAQAQGRVAILVTLCGEDPRPIADSVAELHADLRRNGMGTRFDIFFLSDTAGSEAIAREDAVLTARLSGLPGVYLRRRADRAGRKPGNIADWVRGWGAAYDAMAILDSDSRMTATRLAALVDRLDTDPALGLVQSGMRLVPADSRFGRLQRLSARLCGPVFIAGLASWAGREGNFWGHNAVARVAAFAAAAGLPRLSGRPPFGGDILSHDFIEAAWLRRAGWGVEILPDSRGSFEDGPQTLADFHRRDRRWCQGNLQHVRLLAGARMHPVSRLHLLSGIQSYLSAPVWLGLVLAMMLLAPGASALLPLGGALLLLLVPKFAGALHQLHRVARLRRRPGVLLRALGAEIALSTLVAPLVLVRQTAAVVAVLAGRDAGWTPAGGMPARLRAARLPRGLPEALAGLALLGAGVLFGAEGVALLWLVPLAGPLVLAPLIVPWFDAPRAARRAPHGAAVMPPPARAGAPALPGPARHAA